MLITFIILLSSTSLSAITRAPRDGTLELCDINNCNNTASPIIIVQPCVTCDLSPILIALSTLESPTCATCIGTAITQQALDDAGGIYTIDTPGRYTVAETLFATTPDGAPVIAIKSSNVTLDCCNNSIVCNDVGNSRSGIQVEASLNAITIRNGSIVGAGTSGIRCEPNSSALVIQNMAIAFSGSSGIDCSSIRNLTIDQCLIAQSRSLGMALSECSQFTIRNSYFGESVQRNLIGLSLIGCSLGTITNSSFSDNQAEETTYGCLMQKCQDITFTECSASGNLTSLDGGSIARGFEISDSTRITFNGCSVINLQGATAYGLLARKSETIAWYNGFCTNIDGEGSAIFLESSNQNIVKNALATRITSDGERTARAYHSRDSTNNTFINCIAVATLADRISTAYEIEGGVQASLRNCIALNTPRSGRSVECYGYAFTLDGGSNPLKNGLIEQSVAIGYTGTKLGFGYRDIATPSSTLCATNRAFNCVIPFDITYPFGTIPVNSFTLGGGLPPIGSIGALDNFSLIP